MAMASPDHIVVDNDDLLREILIRLPVESLLRFKLVSKHWLSLITDQRFCLNKSQILCKHISGLFLYRSSFFDDQVYDFIRLDGDNSPPIPPFRILSFLPDHHRRPQTKLKILRSCNGLLLCRSSFQLLKKQIDDIEYNYWIFNPTTSKFIPINPPPASCDGSRPQSSVCAVYLAFDPRKSADYKVIWIYVPSARTDVGIHGFQIGIYSSSSGLWKWYSHSDKPDSHYRSPATAQINLGTGVYWNGSINWTSSRGNSSLYFNVDEERIGTFPMPEIPEILAEEGRRIRYFGESNDHLHLIETTCPLATRFNVYEMMLMDRAYSGWIVKYQVDMEVIMAKPAITSSINQLPSFIFKYYKFAIIDVVRRKDDRDSFLVFSIPGIAVSYNFTDQAVKIHDFDPNHLLGGPPMIGCQDSFRFVYSLMPLA